MLDEDKQDTLASRDWGRKEKADGVDGLSYTAEINLSRDLFDEHGCESL